MSTQYVEDAAATGPYTRIAIEVGITDIDGPTPAADLDRELAWARSVLAKLDKREPKQSSTRDQAIARATVAFKLKDKLGDELDVGLMIAAPNGKTFPGRLVWDAAYAAGFRWGDGDYFHWVPSPTTDISQGIGMGSTNGMGYFIPEQLVKNDGSADVDGLEMSFDVPRTWQPEAVFDVMVRAARYVARRLGGTVLAHDGSPFDEARVRARIKEITQAMAAAGMTPGSSFALQVF